MNSTRVAFLRCPLLVIMIILMVAHLEVVFPYERNSRFCISRAVHEDAAARVRGLPKEALFARRWSPYYDEEDEKMDKAVASGDSRLETKSKLQPLLYKEKPKPVLVVGATGRVGQRIVRQLLSQKVPVRAFVRSYEKAVTIFGEYALGRGSLLEICVGDLNEPDTVEVAVRGCDSVISVSGSIRSSRLSDFLPWRLFRSDVSSWCTDKSHPYYTNYKAQTLLFSLAEKYDLKRIIRMTDLYAGLPPYSFISVVANTMRSMTFRYHAMAEQALRTNCTVPSIILRPGDLINYQRNTQTTWLQIHPSGVLPSPSIIGRDDVATIAIAALQSDDNRTHTLAVRWVGEHMYPQPQGKREEGFPTAKECFDALKGIPSTSLMTEKIQDTRAPMAQVNSYEQSHIVQPFAAYVALAVYSILISMSKFFLSLIRRKFIRS